MEGKATLVNAMEEGITRLGEYHNRNLSLLIKLESQIEALESKISVLVGEVPRPCQEIGEATAGAFGSIEYNQVRLSVLIDRLEDVNSHFRKLI